MLAEALGGGAGRIRKFHRDGWATALAGWPGNAVLHAVLTKPIIAGRCACWRISSDSRCRPGDGRDLELGKAVERVRVVRRPRRRFLSNRPRAQRPSGGTEVDLYALGLPVHVPDICVPLPAFSMAFPVHDVLHWHRLATR